MNQATFPIVRAAADNALVGLTGQAEFVIEAAADGKAAGKPTFKIAAYNGGALRVGAYYHPVVVDLAGLRAGEQVAILLDHDSTQIVGQGKATIGPKSISIDGKITGDDGPASKVVMHAKNGFVWAASIGVAPERVERVDAGGKVTVNGTEFSGPINVVRAGRLGEVSFVAVGADETASAHVAASAAKESVMQFQEWLKARGFEFEKLSDEQRKALQAAYDAEQAKDKPVEVKADAGVDLVAEQRKLLAAEAKRVAGINKVCASQHAEIAAKAIEEGWTVEAAELAVLRAERAKAPSVIVRTDATPTADVLQAAVCLAGKLPKADKAFKPETLEAADRRWRHGIGLQELMLEAAWANGYTGGSFRQDPGGVVRAAFSSVDISGILSNVANKFLLDGYNYVEQSWRAIAGIRPVNDFKTVTSYRLTGDAQFEQVAPGGEIKHGSLGEDSFTNKANTYGKLFGITRTDLINDDLGALTTIPQRLGRGGALGLNHVFWTAFVNNAAFFTAARLNYFEGAATPLGASSLGTAVQMFRDQVDQEGKPLGVTPRILLVPTALEVTAKQIFASTELRDTTANTKYPVANVYAGQFTPVVSAYLANSAYTGYSAVAWYLLADPRDIATIEVAFLNGRDTPIVETAEADFNVLGIQMRGYFDFGVAMQDYRGGVKSKGSA